MRIANQTTVSGLSMSCLTSIGLGGESSLAALLSWRCFGLSGIFAAEPFVGGCLWSEFPVNQSCGWAALPERHKLPATDKHRTIHGLLPVGFRVFFTRWVRHFMTKRIITVGHSPDPDD